MKVTELAYIVMVWAVILGGVIIFQGDPDIADGWRCRVLEIPMDDCRSPQK